jgi:hypothetical protein
MSSVVLEAKLPYLEPKIIDHSDLFSGGFLPLPIQAKKPQDHPAFVRKKTLDYVKRYDRTWLDLTEAFSEFTSRYEKAISISKDLLTDYDKEIVLPTTCALSIWSSASTDLDQIGDINIDRKFKYSDDIMNAVESFYLQFGSQVDEDKSLSMPRGKFIGFPFMIGGADRASNDAYLSISAALVTGFRAAYGQDVPLEDLYAFLYAFHGAPFSMEGSRQQHTSKERLIVLKDGMKSSVNFNPRYRIICMDPKISTMWIRPAIKKMLQIIQKHPIHTQDRSEITTRIDKAKAAGWGIFASDHSKFDFRHGGDRGRQQLVLHGSILKDSNYTRDATYAFNMRFFSYSRREVWELPGDFLLKSGMGTTTLVGCTGNVSSIIGALSLAMKVSPSTVTSQFQSTWDALAWGDDSVIMLKDPSLWPAVQKAFLDLRLEVAEEPTVKYLGNNYLKGQFEGSMDTGYSIGRFIQQQFFPERPKDYPFNLVGYISRLDLIGDSAKSIHDKMLPHFEELGLREPFDYNSRHAELESLLPLVEKQASKIAQLDDVMQLFLHGMDEFDLSGDLDPVYVKLLGLTMTADLTDPAAFLAKVEKEKGNSRVSQRLIQQVAKLATGDLSVYRDILLSLSHDLRAQYSQGSVIY